MQIKKVNPALKAELKARAAFWGTSYREEFIKAWESDEFIVTQEGEARFIVDGIKDGRIAG